MSLEVIASSDRLTFIAEPYNNYTTELRFFATDLTSNASAIIPRRVIHSPAEGDTGIGLLQVCVTLIVLSVIILTTIIGNVFVMAAIVLERNLRNVANYLTASLAVADLLVAVLVMPLAAVNEVSGGWILGQAVCEIWISFDIICCTSSIFHLVAISVDRYSAVTQVDYIHNRSARRMLFMVALSWGLSVVISLPPFFIQKDPGTTGEGDPAAGSDGPTNCIISQNLAYTVFSTVGAFYLPFVLMMFIYWRVYRAARSRIRRKHFKHATDCTNKKQTNHHSGADPKSTPQQLPRDSDRCKPLLHYPPHQSVTQGTFTPTIDSSESQDPVLVPPAVDDVDLPNATGSIESCRFLVPISPMMRSPSAPEYLLRPTSPLSRSNSFVNSSLDLTAHASDRPRTSSQTTCEKRTREKVEQKRERKAARTLAIVTGTFIVCWLPFFIVAILRPFCGSHCIYPDLMMSVIVWLGYFNSLLNPVIYTIFNPDFRLAFRKILFGKYRRPRYSRRSIPPFSTGS